MGYLYAAVLCFMLASSTLAQKIAGPLSIVPGMQPGYTLFAPLNTKTTYLIDNCGRVINTWVSEYFPGNTAYLLPNGNLVRTKRLDNAIIDGGGGGGGIEILDWDSNLIWHVEYNSDVIRQHHDISPLPNGNLLVLLWELKTKEEVLDKGRNPDKLVDNVLWSERILEIKPIPPASVEIVWEWSVWDHTVQDFDPNKSDYGVVSEHPELADINFTAQGIDDWLHANSLDYNPGLDQIILSSPFFNEFWIIDHSTTTEQAATHTGGNSNKGGDLLYRWGNPKAYGRGEAADQKLSGQHHVHWIDDELQQGGKIMVFNDNAGANYSGVYIIGPTQNSQGEYQFSGHLYAPIEPDDVITFTPPERLFSRIMGGAEMLPNGNILICSSLQGTFFEINPNHEILWEYRSPVTVSGIVGRDLNPENGIFSSDPSFRCIRYAPDYSAFDGKSLEPGEPIEGEPWASCELVTGISEHEFQPVQVYPNPTIEKIFVKSEVATQRINVELVTLLGQRINKNSGVGVLEIDVSSLPQGIYVITVNNVSRKILKLNQK